jgi:hypothetical protein
LAKNILFKKVHSSVTWSLEVGEIHFLVAESHLVEVHSSVFFHLVVAWIHLEVEEIHFLMAWIHLEEAHSAALFHLVVAWIHLEVEGIHSLVAVIHSLVA